MFRNVSLATIVLVTGAMSARGQDDAAWQKLDKVNVDLIRIHIDPVIVQAGIEIADWRWIKKDQFIAAKLTAGKALPPGMVLEYSNYTSDGDWLEAGILVDAKNVKVRERKIVTVGVGAELARTDRIFIQLKPEKDQANKEWAGILKDPALEKQKPASGIISSADEFTKLWKAWQGDKKLPEIDFKKQVVFVATSPRGSVRAFHVINNKGDVEVFVGLNNGIIDQCSFGLLAMDREGVKSIQGKPLSK
jgi:hypothetical protein